MEYKQREYPLFSACGLNCGLCPRYQMDGVSKCPGCSGADFLTKHPTCGVLSCAQRKEVEFCFQCSGYPCKKYDGADKSDSFITHMHQLSDMQKAKTVGIDAYMHGLNEKINLLEQLIANYDDGRRKSFFCLAVNLLDGEDIRHIHESLTLVLNLDTPIKEKAAMAARLLNEAADKQGILLKLRTK